MFLTYYIIKNLYFTLESKVLISDVDVDTLHAHGIKFNANLPFVRPTRKKVNFKIPMHVDCSFFIQSGASYSNPC